MKIVSSTKQWNELPGQTPAVDVDYLPLLQHPAVQALKVISEQLQGKGFAITRASGTTAEGKDINAAAYVFPELAAASLFCIRVRSASAESNDRCTAHYFETVKAAYAEKAYRAGLCRFTPALRCMHCHPMNVGGSPACADISSTGMRAPSEPPIAFEAFADALRADNPALDLEALREAYERMPPLSDEMAARFFGLAARTIQHLAQQELDRQQRPASPDAPAPQFVVSANYNRKSTLASLIAQSRENELPVLIEGESGTGKEMLARQIHESSRRAAKPFVTVSCAVLSPNLVEAELFGYVKGAFSGATRNFAGFFERAHGGSIFFDEISEFPLDVQSRLLRVLETGELRPIGGETHKKVNVRVMIATTRNLRELMEQGLFLKPLFYRINGMHIPVPPLRDAPSEIPIYVRTFLEEFNYHHKTEKSITADAEETLSRFSWPGNIRQLRNTVIHAASLAGKKIGLRHLPAEIRDFNPRKAAHNRENAFRLEHLEKEIQAIEKEHIEKAIRECRGNMSEVAKLLEISRFTLYSKLKQLGIQQK